MLAPDGQSVVGFRAGGARRSHEKSPPETGHARLAGCDGSGVLLGIRFAGMVGESQVLRVVLAEGAVPPIDKPCGEGLMPDGVEALRDLGITIPEGEAYPFRGIRFVSEGIRAEAAFPRGTAYGIRRTHLHRVLLDHATTCGVRLLWQAAVTGLHPEGALVAGKLVRARWVVGADGGSSRVRGWAKLDQHELDASRKKNRRFGFRRHYRVAPWTDFMELHWGRHCQIYVTPVSREEICLALVSSSPKLRLRMDDALGEFPELSARLKDAE